MRFIITAQAGEHGKQAQADGAFDEKLFTDYMKFNEEMYRAGVLVASEGLNAAGGGARIEVKKGKRVVVDGPFAESKELVGGFYIVEVSFARRGGPVGAALPHRPGLRRCARDSGADRRGRHPASRCSNCSGPRRRPGARRSVRQAVNQVVDAQLVGFVRRVEREQAPRRTTPSIRARRCRSWRRPSAVSTDRCPRRRRSSSGGCGTSDGRWR